MTEARLRELERRWKQSGALDDEVAYLYERVRAGLVDDAQLDVARRFGSQAAARVLGQPVPRSPSDVRGWMREVEALGDEAQRELLLGAGRACVVRLEGDAEHGSAERFLGGLRALARADEPEDARAEVHAAEEVVFAAFAAIPKPARSTRQELSLIHI